MRHAINTCRVYVRKTFSSQEIKKRKKVKLAGQKFSNTVLGKERNVTKNPKPRSNLQTNSKLETI